MKKKIFVIGVAIITFIILLYYNQEYFLSHSICGSGIHGLKQTGLYYLVVILLILILFIAFNKKTCNNCSFCKSCIDESWNICPYCGKEV